MLKNQIRRLLAGTALLGASFAVSAQSPEQLSARYTALAGSETNAKSLVTGLRDGTDVKLSSGAATTTIDPPTGKMGYGNVNIALALAEKSLLAQGITQPSADQLKAALNGGTVTDSSGKTVQMSGVLQMRASGKGWGEIAHALGFKLGDVVRSAKVDGAGKADRAGPKSDRVAHAERGDRPDRAERGERPDRAMRPERPERSSR
jgi:hypothetical protein